MKKYFMVAEEDIDQTELKSFVKNRDLATIRVRNWFGPLNKNDISDCLNISRPTLNRRLLSHDWKLREIKLILQHMPF